MEDIENMTDTELVAWLVEAKADLTKAAGNEPNSEWHGACFAAIVLLAREAGRRGITLTTTH